MKALTRFLGAPSLDDLREIIARLEPQRTEIERQIVQLEGTRQTTAPRAADGDQQAKLVLDRANASLIERRQALSNLDLAIKARRRELRDAEAAAVVAARQQELAKHRQLLAERAAVAQRIETALSAIAPELVELLKLHDQIRLNYQRLGGRGPHGRGIFVDEIEPGMVQRRMADYLFKLGVRQGLLGANPFLLTGSLEDDYAAAEAKAQRLYSLEN